MPKQSEIKQEELQEFWEWCGFVDVHYNSLGAIGQKWAGRIPPETIYGRDWQYLDIDLNNLFKYAVPKLLPKYAPIEMIAYPSNSYGYHFSLMKKYSADHKDPALALYQAIQKARRTNEQD